MTKRAWAAPLMVLLVASALPVWSQQTRVYKEGRAWVEETTGTLPASRSVRVRTDLGNIQVQGSGQQITYSIKKRAYADNEAEARRQFEKLRITAASRAGTTAIDGDWPGPHKANRFSADFAVQVPRDIEVLSINTLGGNLAASEINGRLEAETSGGNISVDGIGGSVRATTGGGNASIGNIGGELVLKSGGGNVNVGSAKGAVQITTGGGRVSLGTAQATTIHTGGGNIDVKQCMGDLIASTGGGSVDVGEVGGKANVETGGGSIHLATAKGRVVARTGGGSIELLKVGQGAQAQTGAGSITAEFVGKGRDSFTDSSLRTSAGDIIVYLSSGLPVTVRAASEMASGRGIRSEFPELKITSEGGDVGPKTMYAEGSLNGGGAMLKVQTTIGQIEFRRGK